jgi:hypothetical protein
MLVDIKIAQVLTRLFRPSYIQIKKQERGFKDLLGSLKKYLSQIAED